MIVVTLSNERCSLVETSRTKGLAVAVAWSLTVPVSQAVALLPLLNFSETSLTQTDCSNYIDPAKLQFLP